MAELVQTGERADLDFVLKTLHAYDGREDVYPLCIGHC